MSRNTMKRQLSLLLLFIFVGGYTFLRQNTPGRALAGTAPVFQAAPTSTPASISALIEQADEYFASMYFVSPPGANAFETYQQVLTLDPVNAHAWEKIRQMADICKAWGDSAYAQGFQEEAITFYQRYLQIARMIAERFNESGVQSNIEAVTARLTEMGAAPTQSQPAGSESNPPGPQSTGQPPAVAGTPAPQKLPEIISDYYRRYRAGEDIWTELNQNALFLPLLILGVVVLVILLVAGIYLGIIRPRIKRRPLNKVLKLITGGVASDLVQAEELVEQALTSGLDKSSIAEARFAQIYVRARLNKYPEASALMKDFLRKTSPDQETVYLAMWLYNQQKQYEEVAQVYGQYRDQLRDLLDTRMIAGIAYLQLGQQHWEQREVKLALQYFDMLRELNILNEYIPSHTDDYQVVLGITSLFDGKLEQAREYFEGAKEEAQKAGKATVEAELGLLACEWREQDFPDIDDELGKVLARMGEIPLAPRAGGNNILLRNVRLWYVISRLFTWYKLPEKKGLPDKEKKEVLERIQQIKAIDAKNTDADLLKGLIMYYFDQDNKEQAVQVLKDAQSNGVGVPDVINLVQREEKALEQQRNALSLYLELVKKYLNDSSVPLDLRQELKGRLDKFTRFHQLDKEIKLGSREDDALPSLQDIQNRGQSMRSRVENIIRTRLVKEDASKIKGLLTTLNEAANWLSEDKNDLEEVEQELMLQTGEFLFLEEEVNAPQKEQPEAGPTRVKSKRDAKQASPAKTPTAAEILTELCKQVEESNQKLEEYWKILVWTLPVDGSRSLTEEEAKQGNEIRAYLKQVESQSQQAALKLSQLRSSGADYDPADLGRTEMLYQNQTLWRGDFRRKLRKLNLLQEVTPVNSPSMEP